MILRINCNVIGIFEQLAQGRDDLAGLMEAIREGAVLRVRPKAMTVAVILAGLFPIMWGGGTGSEVMQRIAAPMVGGMITAPLMSMFVIPVAFLLIRKRLPKTPTQAEKQQLSAPFRSPTPISPRT